MRPRFHRSFRPARPAVAAVGAVGKTCSVAWGAAQREYSALRAFIAGAVAITLAGAAINLLIYVAPWLGRRSAPLLLVPLDRRGRAAGRGPGGRGLGRRAGNRRPARKRPPIAMRGDCFSGSDDFESCSAAAGWRWRSAWPRTIWAIGRSIASPRRSRGRIKLTVWRISRPGATACEWVVDSGKIPPGARFLTPRMAQTFKWYTGHSEVATWKDIPQDAQELVQWWARLQDDLRHRPPAAQCPLAPVARRVEP